MSEHITLIGGALANGEALSDWIALAADYARLRRWRHAMRALSEAISLARKLAGEIPPLAPVLCCPDCGSRHVECDDCASRFTLSDKRA